MNVDKMLNMYLLDRSKKDKYTIISITTYNEGRKSTIHKVKINNDIKKSEEFRNKRDMLYWLSKKENENGKTKRQTKKENNS